MWEAASWEKYLVTNKEDDFILTPHQEQAFWQTLLISFVAAILTFVSS